MDDSVLPDHHSAVRSMLATAAGGPYRAYASLQEAAGDPCATVVMEGDYGGQIYLTCPVRRLGCDVATLDRVLHALADCAYDDPDGARVYFEHLPPGSGVAGGSGGGAVFDGVWVHPEFEDWWMEGEEVSLARAAADVVAGRRDALPPPPYVERHGVPRSELPRSNDDSAPGVLRRPDGDLET